MTEIILKTALVNYVVTRHYVAVQRDNDWVLRYHDYMRKRLVGVIWETNFGELRTISINNSERRYSKFEELQEELAIRLLSGDD